ncbi:MAG: methyltransferase [Chloroflexi bacterium]|nr:methyltransferase [Chloroflexota bacterium]
MNSLLLRSLHRKFLMLQRQWWRVDLKRARLHHVHGTPLIILPDVFDGVLTRTGVFLVETLHDLDLHNARVLDLGCGSGIGAVFAAQRGARVMAVDVNPDATRNAQLNALLSHLENQIDTRTGDLFETVRDERFDLILFNPPYYHGAPRDAADAAWRSRDTFERFLDQFPKQLAPHGRARIVLSSDGDIEASLAAAAAHLKTNLVRRHDFHNEILTVYDLYPLCRKQSFRQD